MEFITKRAVKDECTNTTSRHKVLPACCLYPLNIQPASSPHFELHQWGQDGIADHCAAACPKKKRKHTKLVWQSWHLTSPTRAEFCIKEVPQEHFAHCGSSPGWGRNLLPWTPCEHRRSKTLGSPGNLSAARQLFAT